MSDQLVVSGASVITCRQRATINKVIRALVFFLASLPLSSYASLDIQLECRLDRHTLLSRAETRVERSRSLVRSWCSGKFPDTWSNEVGGVEIQLPSDMDGFFYERCVITQKSLLEDLESLSKFRELCPMDSWGVKKLVSASGEIAITETSNCANPESPVKEVWTFDSASQGPWSSSWLFKSAVDFGSLDVNAEQVVFNLLAIHDRGLGSVSVALELPPGSQRYTLKESRVFFSSNDDLEWNCSLLE